MVNYISYALLEILTWQGWAIWSIVSEKNSLGLVLLQLHQHQELSFSWRFLMVAFLLIDKGLMDAEKVEIVSSAQLCQIVISLLLPLVLRPTMAL
jgi:hypothetical protein